MTDFATLREFYTDHLLNDLVRFWMRFGIDEEYGGYFTCFTNRGDKLISTDKYLWSQGRFLWMLSRLVYAFGDRVDAATREQWRRAAERGARFLAEHALLPNGNCAWVLRRDGTPIMADTDRGEYDLSINADQFVIYGMAEYARAAQDPKYFQFALDLFDSVEKRLASGNYKTAPHVVPAGYKVHAGPMMMVETANELSQIAAFFEDPSAERILHTATTAMGEVLRDFVQPERRILLEMIRDDGTPEWETLLGSYANPGHAIEDAWFMMHLAERIGDSDSLQEAAQLVRWMWEAGWDEEWGGLYQFVHAGGGPPRGEIPPQNRNDHMITELQNNWYNKLWWVHSETLYALLLSYEHTRDPWFLEHYEQTHEYVFRTFPNPDREIGEWIQIRDREGNPEEKVVALPVKDPYHITRAFMHAIACLERLERTG